LQIIPSLPNTFGATGIRTRNLSHPQPQQRSLPTTGHYRLISTFFIASACSLAVAERPRCRVD